MRLSSTHSWDLLAALAGILFTPAFAPFDQSYLAVAALSLLFASWQHITPRRALLRGYLFGLGSFGLGVSWVYISVHDFGGANIAGSCLITGLFVGFWAWFPALAGYLSVKIGPPVPLMVMPAAWLLIEYLRGYLVLNGFPWLQVAYSQLETPLAGYIPILGVYGTGFLAALTAAVLVFMFRAKKHRLLLAAALIALWTAGGMLRAVKWTNAAGNPIRVALIQGNIAQDQKWRPENRLNTLRYYKTMTEQHWDTAAVIVWPETSIPAYLDDVNDGFLLPLGKAALQHNVDLIVSLPAHGNSETEKYNAVMTLGKETGLYRKRHLLPFGEYLPWQPVSGFILNSLAIKLGNFTPGDADQALLKAGGYPFITSICYEDAFGDAGLRGLPDAAYLVNVTNDGWFGDSIEPRQHLQIARMRALETGRFLLRSTNTGVTAIIAPDGSVTHQAPLFKATALTGEITPMSGMTPYAELGDKPVIYSLAGMLVGLVIANRRLLSRKRGCRPE